jgi:hypothetical protein
MQAQGLLAGPVADPTCAATRLAQSLSTQMARTQLRSGSPDMLDVGLGRHGCRLGAHPDVVAHMGPEQHRGNDQEQRQAAQV